MTRNVVDSLTGSDADVVLDAARTRGYRSRRQRERTGSEKCTDEYYQPQDT